jgi:hypothetical protein
LQSGATPARREAEDIASAVPGAECSRRWIAIDGEELLPAHCGEAGALLDLAAVPNEKRTLKKAALDRAAEIAELESAPRIPQLRPEPPSVTQDPRRKIALAKWPTNQPPKCGSGKRAKWHYVNRVPTWYCRAYRTSGAGLYWRVYRR